MKRESSLLQKKKKLLQTYIFIIEEEMQEEQAQVPEFSNDSDVPLKPNVSTSFLQ